MLKTNSIFSSRRFNSNNIPIDVGKSCFLDENFTKISQFCQKHFAFELYFHDVDLFDSSKNKEIHYEMQIHVGTFAVLFNSTLDK